MAWHIKNGRQKKRGKLILRLGSYALIAVSLNACSTLSMSDFGLGDSKKKTTVATTQNKTAAPNGPVNLGGDPRASSTLAKKSEKGVWDRVTGWFSSDDKPKVTAPKQNNLLASQANQTTAATNASLRAAQDISKIENQATTTNKALDTAKIQPIAPSKVAANQPQALQNTAPKTAISPRQPSQPSAQAPSIKQTDTKLAAQQPKNNSFFDRIGSWFSSDKKKPVATTKSQPNSSINSLASSGTKQNPINESDEAETLTPVETLRLSRRTGQSTASSSQGLVPYVPNTSNAVKISQKADTQINTGATKTVKAAVPQKITLKNTPKLSTTKVAVKPLSKPSKTTRAPQVSASKPVAAKTEYVVTPESYRALKSRGSLNSNAPTNLANRTAPKTAAASQTNKKSNFLGAAPLNTSATKFYFGPGSTSLAPHHVAQLKGIAGQALARQRQVVVLGTSTPGGEAGSGATKEGLQRLATARAMATAQNLQKFGVPGNLIKIKIAQSTTPTDIGTGGDSSFQALSARRVEISLQ